MRELEIQFCNECPFRNSGKGVQGLNEDRLFDIVETDGQFNCHKTVNYDDDGSGHGGKPCGGILLFLSREQNFHMAGMLNRLSIGMDLIPDAIKANHSQVCSNMRDLIERHQWRKRA